MSLDGFRRVLFNAGEQGVASDYNALQRLVHMHVLELMTLPRVGNSGGDPTGGLGRLDPEQMRGIAGLDDAAVPLDIALCPFPALAYFVPTAVARQIQCLEGPLVQILDTAALASPAEATQAIAVFWTSGFTLTTDVGDATNPRIDVVEMKLEFLDTGLESRAYSQDPIRATLDLNPLTTNCETVLRAKVAGDGGNNISIAFTPDGTGAGSLTQSGNALTFHYESGVTLVTDFETAVAASTLIEIQTVDGAGTLSDPGDTFGATSFSGGVDRLIMSASVNKDRQVQATFQLKKGTAAAAPAYPACTAGFVAVAAVYVPATHNAVHNQDNLRDLRMPIGGLEIHDVNYNEMVLDTGGGGTWTVDHTAWKVLSSASPGQTYGIGPGGNCGRLVGVACYGRKTSGDDTVVLQRAEVNGGSNPNYVDIANLSTGIGGVLNTSGPCFVFIDEAYLMDQIDATGPWLGTRVANSRIGTPVWTNGKTQGPALKIGTGSPGDQLLNTSAAFYKLALKFLSGGSGDFVSLVRFYVARGMR